MASTSAARSALYMFTSTPPMVGTSSPARRPTCPRTCNSHCRDLPISSVCLALTPRTADVTLAVRFPKRMRAVDLIRKKRDSGELSREEINFLVSGYTCGEIPDYQMAAWLMAVWIRGLNRSELAALTEVMLYSGEVLNHSEIAGKKVDKHSTGGIGDKTSLILAPIVAAGGLTVPMISGRGLGHTGGTLDKLEAIPGFNVNLSLEEFRRVLSECGMGLIGQTAEIAPADKKIYALRDATSTVENIGLICASIMSKKLAEGIDALVLDVKVGSGAFMKREEEAANLAEVMIETGKRMGKQVVALITDMDQPLGRAAGHANEGADCERFGIALAILGGVREKKEDAIDHAVGLQFHKRIGDHVEKGEPLATIHYNADARLAEAKALIAENYFIAQEPPRGKRPLIRRILGA